MAYDIHGAFENFLGFNAPLYSNDTLSVSFAVNYWLSLGATPDKLVLGLPTYGKSFTKSGAGNTLGSGASGAGTAGRVHIYCFREKMGELILTQNCSQFSSINLRDTISYPQTVCILKISSSSSI